jgi:hypothetical protein
MTLKTICVVPDSHAKPNVSMRRYEWLGSLIKDINPDFVVDLGDWGDMESLCSYDKGKKDFEGRRYAKDIEAAHEARSLVDVKLKSFKGKRFALVGNHENRISRAVNDDAKLEGLISINDLKPKNWEYIDFLEPLELCGFIFQHYFTSGVMGKPIGGEYPAGSILKKQFISSVSGHSHVWDYCTRTSGKRTKLQSFVCGAYLDPNQFEKYAGPSNYMWNNSITILKGVEDGYCHDGYEVINMKAIQREYSK